MAKRKCRNTSSNKNAKLLRKEIRPSAHPNHSFAANECSVTHISGQKSGKMALKKMLITRMNDQIATQMCSKLTKKDKFEVATRDECIMNVADALLNMRQFAPSA